MPESYSLPGISDQLKICSREFAYQRAPTKDEFINIFGAKSFNYACEPVIAFENINRERQENMRRCIQQNDAQACNTASRLWSNQIKLTLEFYWRNPPDVPDGIKTPQKQKRLWHL